MTNMELPIGANATSIKVRKILRELKRHFLRIYGKSNVEKVILYGSRARGDARDDSDIDVLVVMKQEFNYGEALRLSSKLVASLSLENDVVISRAFVTKAQYEHLQIPFLMNVRREGVAV